MKIPKKIRISGHDYKVKWDDKKLSKEKLIGDINNDFKEIRLCKHYKSKRARAQSELERCLFHEILHGIDCHYNNDSLSEKEVDRLSNGLYQVLSDNFIIKTKKEEK
ncbi:MAG: hypothetical protein KAW56_05340 [Candidatus Marinimicrobia bacterium]|nr:hypothetical protein [Candidatus Neomarinimicrobiota bacterium]MCK4446486.1 hypothetical protein [Candidatus Neomarinimicrobiota bacterium]